MNKITSLLVYSQHHNETAKWIDIKFGYHVFSGLKVKHRFGGMQQIHFKA